MKFRRQRIGDQIKVELADLVRDEVRDPRIGFVTFTEVRMSPDLKYARVYVSILGEPEERRETLAALVRAGGFLRRHIGKRLQLRFVPELRFVLDETLDHSERIDELLEGTEEVEDDADAE